ncbi:hypothetical protein [Streptomyces tauricus]
MAAVSDLPRWALCCGWIVFTTGTVLAFAIPGPRPSGLEAS